MNIPKNIQAASLSYKFKFVGAVESDATFLKPGELLRLTGPAIFLDRISGNGRKYIPESVHMQVADLQERIMAKALFGELDHPPTDDLNRLAYVKMSNASHRIDALWYDRSKDIYYITVTILDTPNGRILKTISDTGSPLYVSLRSLLDPNRNKQQNGYIDAWMLALITVDFVSRAGFADAVLTPIATSNEAMQAVCESLNIFNHTNMTTKQNTFVPKYKVIESASEQLSGVACKPTPEFSEAITRFIADVLSKFPGQFSASEFDQEYQGIFENFMVGLYADTANLSIVSHEDNCTAIIPIKTATDGYFNVSDDTDITYFETDSNPIDSVAAEMYKVIEPTKNRQNSRQGMYTTAKSVYPIIATEDYVPSESFMQTVTKLANDIRSSFSNGFTSEDMDAINTLAGDACTVTLEDDENEYELQVTCGNDKATISLTGSDGTYLVDSITEYEQANDEMPAYNEMPAYEVLEGVQQQTDGMPIAAAKPKVQVPGNGLTNIMAKGDTNTGENVQTYKVVDEESGNQAEQQLLNDAMYEIIEGDGTSQTYAVVTDEDDVPEASDDTADTDEELELNLNNNELATEAARIFGMPNSKYAGHYAIEHMPIAYKHIWQGLSATAKAILVKQSATVANESANLKFWSSTNFIAIERAALMNDKSVESALESLVVHDPRKAFLAGK